MSGLTKLRDWSVSLALFQDEYRAPLPPSEVAALMEPGGELVLPALLMLGPGGRFAALGLFGCGKWAGDTRLAGRRPQPTSSLRAPARS